MLRRLFLEMKLCLLEEAVLCSRYAQLCNGILTFDLRAKPGVVN